MIIMAAASFSFTGVVHFPVVVAGVVAMMVGVVVIHGVEVVGLGVVVMEEVMEEVMVVVVAAVAVVVVVVDFTNIDILARINSQFSRKWINLDS